MVRVSRVLGMNTHFPAAGSLVPCLVRLAFRALLACWRAALRWSRRVRTYCLPVGRGLGAARLGEAVGCVGTTQLLWCGDLRVLGLQVTVVLLPLRYLGPRAMSWGLTSLRSMSVTLCLGGLSGGLERRWLGGGVVWSRRLNTHSVLVELELLEISHGWVQPGLKGPPPRSKSDSYSTPYSS